MPENFSAYVCPHFSNLHIYITTLCLKGDFMKRNGKTLRAKVRKQTPDHAMTKAIEDMHHKVKRGYVKHRGCMYD